MNRPSLNEISALLDDSGDDVGHRLAEYLLKKQGKSNPQRVFGKYEPKRYSDFKIRLKKLPNVKKVAETEQRFPVEAETNKDDTEKQEEVGHQVKPMNQLQESIFGAVGSAQIDEPPLLVNTEQVEVGDDTRKLPLTVQNSPPQGTTRSTGQRLSTLKSGGIPSADRLRRYSMKRLSTISTSGRRMLLNEFNSLAAETDFLPNHCSTPMTVPTSPKTPTKQTATAAADRSKTLINVSPCPFNETVSSSTDSKRLLIGLQRRDEALRDILEKDIDTINQNLEEQENLDRILKTPSPKPTSNSSMRCRTYTIEKGTQPGQVILTPSKMNTTNVMSTIPDREQLQQQDANTYQYPNAASPKEKSRYALRCASTHVTPEKTAPTAHNKTPQNASPRVLQTLRMMGKSPQQMSTRKSKIPSRIPLRAPLGPEIPNTPVGAAVAEQCDDVEIPETQEQHHVSQLPGTPVRPPTINELTQSFQGTKSPMVVVPIYQTFNQLPQTESNFKVGTENKTTASANEQAAPSTENIKKSEDKGVNTTNNLINKTFNKSRNKTFNKPTSAKKLHSQTHATFVHSQNNLANYIDIDDNLRFEDIVTDDEDDAPQAPGLITQNSLHKTDLYCSNAPLNLAPSPELCDARRTRNRSARRKLISKDNETEVESWPPRAHPLTVTRVRTRTQLKRQNVPLNAEPRTPINGEKFATELKSNLARLKNHEILDLRKRNSLGKVYATSGRKSLADKKFALEKQLQLENEIQFELLRRNWESDDNGVTPIVQEDDHNEGDNDIFEIPPAPDGFRDRTVQPSDIMEQQETCNKDDLLLSQIFSYDSSLIDDRSCDRVSFVPRVIHRKSSVNKSKKGSRRVKKSNVSKEVQMYLDVSNKLNKHKPSDKSKRSLYSQKFLSPPSSPRSQHISEDFDANTELSLHLRVDTSSSDLSSAQKSSTNRKSCENQILNPPQDFTDHESNTNMKVISIVGNENEIFKKPLPPPQAFTDDESHTNMRISPIVENYNEIFKKPLPPPPPRKSKQQKLTKNRTVVTEEISGLEALKDVAETHLPPRKRGRKKKTIANTTQQKEQEAAEPLKGNEKNENEIFKKPLPPPPARRRKQQKLNKTRPAVIEELSDNFEEDGAVAETHLPPPQKVRKKKTADITTQEKEPETAEPLEENETSSSLRRSKRGHMPLKNYWSFRSTDPMPLYDFAILEKRKEEAKLLRESRKKNKACLGDTNVSSASSRCVTMSAQKIRTLAVISESEEFTNEIRQENERPKVNVPHSTAVPNIPIKAVDVEKLNNMFDQLRNAPTILDNEKVPSATSSSQSNENIGKKLRVRLKRIDPNKEHTKVAQEKPKTSDRSLNVANVHSAIVPEQYTVDEVVAEPLVTPSQNDSDVLSWLRNISLANSKAGTKNQNMFEELVCSNSGNLVLSNLDDLEYVYYDNDPDGNVSYLRFNPHQRKSSKKAKKFNLQFVVLSGEFTFTTNKDLATVKSGALIKVVIGARYSIKNITDKKAILMVLKEGKSDSQ